MILYTYQDELHRPVDEAYITTDEGQANDHAARTHRRLMQVTVEQVAEEDLVADYTPEDESDG